ncbi:MAG: aconitase X catalytic domain-containing protein, partial [Rhodospirillales bacterium]|nr:aconitase X catalytic domain-containing protein [Rhodospirillales bacterium]
MTRRRLYQPVPALHTALADHPLLPSRHAALIFFTIGEGEPAMTDLTPDERAMTEGRDGPAAAMAMRIVAETARILGAERLIPVTSAHVDGCLYHGDSGVYFVERLVELEGRVAVPTTLNVGALDLIHPERVHADPHATDMARRMMAAYEALGCAPTWTCAPYQVGHRPDPGEDVAWGESNAVAFCNSVLGARTNRNGDFLDISAALAGRAPYYGLHVADNRLATVVVGTASLSDRLKAEDAFYPVLGAWLGAEVAGAVAVIDGLPADMPEDRLKALGAGAASNGAVGLFHVAGVTPEAPTLEAALGGRPAEQRIELTPEVVRAARDALSTAPDGPLDALAVGSPHFSIAEFDALEERLAGRRASRPFYACTNRQVLRSLEASGALARIEAAGIEIITDTCIVVTPILPAGGGVLMTNSAKFAQYTPSNTDY